MSLRDLLKKQVTEIDFHGVKLAIKPLGVNTGIRWLKNSARIQDVTARLDDSDPEKRATTDEQQEINGYMADYILSSIQGATHEDEDFILNELPFRDFYALYTAIQTVHNGADDGQQNPAPETEGDDTKKPPDDTTPKTS